MRPTVRFAVTALAVAAFAAPAAAAIAAPAAPAATSVAAPADYGCTAGSGDRCERRGARNAAEVGSLGHPIRTKARAKLAFSAVIAG